MSSTLSGAVFQISREVNFPGFQCLLSINYRAVSHINIIVTDNKLTAAVHFDSKARVDDYIRDLSVPHTIIHVGMYTSFLLESLVSLSATPPSYGLILPKPANAKTTLPLIDPVIDLGKFVKAILLNPDKTLGRKINVAERYYTLEEIIAVLNGLGINAIYQTVDQQVFKAGLASKGLPEFFQEGLTQVVQFVEEYGFFGGEGIEEGHQVFFSPSLFVSWAKLMRFNPIKLVIEPLSSLEESLKNSAEFAKLSKQ